MTLRACIVDGVPCLGHPTIDLIASDRDVRGADGVPLPGSWADWRAGLPQLAAANARGTEHSEQLLRADALLADRLQARAEAGLEVPATPQPKAVKPARLYARGLARPPQDLEAADLHARLEEGEAREAELRKRLIELEAELEAARAAAGAAQAAPDGGGGPQAGQDAIAPQGAAGGA